MILTLTVNLDLVITIFYTGIVDLTSIISLDAEEFVNINIKYSTFSYATTSLGKLYVWGHDSIRAPYLVTLTIQMNMSYQLIIIMLKQI